jgi:hypothetical protein
MLIIDRHGAIIFESILYIYRYIGCLFSKKSFNKQAKRFAYMHVYNRHIISAFYLYIFVLSSFIIFWCEEKQNNDIMAIHLKFVNLTCPNNLHISLKWEMCFVFSLIPWVLKD